MSKTPTKRLVVFCDGTWCGRETNSSSNIGAVAQMVGHIRFLTRPGERTTTVHPIDAYVEDVTAGYQEGTGLNKTFLEYIWDGATASSIGDECVSVYKFIVENYTKDHEIYLFGFSRGAYTVRCVAGMINNCGILKRDTQQPLSDEDISTLCREVYRTYRSPLDIDRPKSSRCTKLRNDSTRVWPAKRPVRLMCIIDTVGALGIPRINAGVGFDWPEFYDQKVSTVVQEVYHAPALHDRLWIFQPCLAYNDPTKDDEPDCVKIHQTWFPGCHYDVGRQQFRFLRHAPGNQLEGMIGAIPALLSKTIYPNEVLANAVLRWMLQAVQKMETVDTRETSMIPDIVVRIQSLSAALAAPSSTQPTGPAGSGDIYGDILEYAPASRLFMPFVKLGSAMVSVLNHMWPQLGDNLQDLLGIGALMKILTATRDRRIPGIAADVYPYKRAEVVEAADGSLETFVLEDQARMTEQSRASEPRYPSRTYESFELWKRVFESQTD